MGVPTFDANRYPNADLTSGFLPTSLPHGGEAAPAEPSYLGLNKRDFTVATGYLATGLVALTLLIGPVNVARRRRNPVSSYFRRDVGIWAAVFSGVHVLYGFQIHGKLSVFDYFVSASGVPHPNSFGLANWLGLAGLVVVAGLLALSSDAALRLLKARNWKRWQRFNYALFALVLAHAVFYGALVRTSSPYTSLLLVSAAAVVTAQAVGVFLYRRRDRVS